MLTLPLSNSHLVTRMDDADADLAVGYRWRLGDRGYVIASVRHPVRTNVKLHRLVVGAEPGEIVDHADGDLLNNTRGNLRRCTNQQNAWNMRTKPGTSRFKGVCFNIRYGTWRAYLRINDRQLHLGTFGSEIEAAAAYDAKAAKVFGSFARLNFSSCDAAAR